MARGILRLLIGTEIVIATWRGFAECHDSQLRLCQSTAYQAGSECYCEHKSPDCNRHHNFDRN